MAKTKFVLTASPTFKAVALIPVPGGQPQGIEFTYKHRPRDEYNEWVEKKLPHFEGDADLVLDIASGWSLEEPFDRDHVEQLVQNYLGSAKAILEKYITENVGARRGN